MLPDSDWRVLPSHDLRDLQAVRQGRWKHEWVSRWRVPREGHDVDPRARLGQTMVQCVKQPPVHFVVAIVTQDAQEVLELVLELELVDADLEAEIGFSI